MKPIERSDKRWQVYIPAKLTRSGKREARYFPSKNQATKFIADFKVETREHGRSAFSHQDREWLSYARSELGDLARLPEVIQYWKRFASKLAPMSVAEGVRLYLADREAEYSGNQKTWSDVRGRLGRLADHFSNRQLREISVGDMEAFLASQTAGTRDGSFKRCKLFFDFAVARNWIAESPLKPIKKPKTAPPKREIYTPEDLKKMLWTCERDFPQLTSYVVLMSFGYMRSGELVKERTDEETLQWSDVHADFLDADPVIHVRHHVAKGTRRESDERFVKLNEAALAWLRPIRKKSGPCVEVEYDSQLRKLFHAMQEKAGVRPVKNGLRHSCISYSLAKWPEHGVALVSSWAGNSESTIQKHYKRLTRRDEGDAWFNVRPFDPEAEALREAEQRRIEVVAIEVAQRPPEEWPQRPPDDWEPPEV